MVWFEKDSDQARAYDDVMDADDLTQFTTLSLQNLVANAAAYEAERAWKDQLADTGGVRPPYEQAVHLTVGVAGQFINRLVETKGLKSVEDFDPRKTLQMAEEMIKEHLNKET